MIFMKVGVGIDIQRNSVIASRKFGSNIMKYNLGQEKGKEIKPLNKREKPDRQDPQ